MIKPMLAAKLGSIDDIEYPIMVSPKLDGIRCLCVDGVAYSRNMKPIRNKHIQSKLAGLHLLDGELIVGPPNAEDAFQKSSSGVMSFEGKPKFAYHVFDSLADDVGFRRRYELVCKAVRASRRTCVVTVPHALIKTRHELTDYEGAMLLRGYEGVMIRSLDGPYKHGRATAREGTLLKMKRFEDSEAKIVGAVEQLTNQNPAEQDELGRSKRSSAAAGKVAAGVLGALSVRDVKTGAAFEIGSGFTAAQRVLYWQRQKQLVGKFVRYKFQPHGVKDKPRFPVFQGFRDANDFEEGGDSLCSS